MGSYARTACLVLLGVGAWGFVAEARAETLLLEFDAAGGTVLDGAGVGSGFTARLPGTGAPEKDPLLKLDTAESELELTSTFTDFNGGTGLARLSAPGIKLSSLGYTGAEDFEVRAKFKPIDGLQSIDQVGIYIGVDGKNLTRAGVIMFAAPEYLAVHTTESVDNNGRFYGTGVVVADGLEVILRRTGGKWEYLIDGVAWHPNSSTDGTGAAVDPNGESGSPKLDEAGDLYVGVFANTVFNTNANTALVDAFEVTVGPEPAENP